MERLPALSGALVELYDLTQPLFAGMPVYPGDPPVSAERVCSHEADGYQVTQICLGSHSGTHMDAPRHFFAAGATLDQFPVDRFVGPGVLVDCTEAPETALAASPPPIGAQLLKEKLHPHKLPAGCFVLLRTGGRLLSAEAAQLLLDRGAGLVGTDAPGLDEEPYVIHKLLLGNDVLLVENLSGLDRITPGRLMCACLPLSLLGADGAPARVVVWR